jgi:glycosyltransferase involved in cell wall biosynthesis
VIASIGKLLKKPVVLTYHCDLQLPKGTIHYIANQGSHLANHLAARNAGRIVTNTQDYADHSQFLQKYISKIEPIPPPIELEPYTDEDVRAFRTKYGINPEQRIIGMAARLATEKGVEYLVRAFPKVLEQFPDARVLFAGQHLGVLGEEIYAQKLAPLIQQLGKHWTFLGILPPKEWSIFFNEAEVTVLPSINSTESFGMVQVESMISGTPVIASDLPGIRQPILTTGMGVIVPPQNPNSLAQALISVLKQPNGYKKDIRPIRERYSPQTIARAYEEIFSSLFGQSH